MPENTPKKAKSVSEKGHAKFLESLDKLIAFDATLDPLKLDAPPDLTSAALNALRTKATAEHEKVSEAKAGWRTTTQERQADNEQINSKASQAVAALEAHGASRETVEAARSYVRKLQGRPSADAPQDNPLTLDVDESEGGISNSQQSNAARIAIFIELIDFLDIQPEYKDVKTPGLTVADLRLFIETMDTKHQASILNAASLAADRGTRNGTFYEDQKSVLNIAKRYKKLVFGNYGSKSPEYKAVNAIPFQKASK